jgi:hypothetical protein
MNILYLDQINIVVNIGNSYTKIQLVYYIANISLAYVVVKLAKTRAINPEARRGPGNPKQLYS